MAESIAKLAVIITGDAAPLARAMGQASAAITKTERSTIKLSSALSALRGNWSAAFGVGGGGALAITAMAAGVFKLAAAGDHLMQKIGADKLETWAGQWERVNEQLGVMGLRFSTIAAESSSALADTLGGINEALFPDAVALVNAIKEREAREKSITEQKKKQEEANKKQAQANKEAAEAQQRERDALLDMANAQRDRGDAIREAVRTPLEEMKATFAELRALLSQGFLDEQTAIRAGEAAAKRFKDAIAAPERAMHTSHGVAAADRFSVAGFSAVQSGLRDLDRLEKVQKDQLAEQKRQTKVQEEIAKAMANLGPPVVIHEGNPP